MGCRTLFDDALEAVGTAASVGVIKDRILKGDATPETIESWIASLTYIPKPDYALMQAAVHILRVREKYPNILLTFSSLAHSYCRSRTQCTLHSPILLLTQLFDKSFSAHGCVTKKPRDVEQVIS